MLETVSGSTDYYARGPRAERSGFFKRIGDAIRENVTLKIMEFRYDRARSDMVKSSTRAQYAKALSVGLMGIHKTISGFVQRTEQKAEAHLNKTEQTAQQVTTNANEAYSAFVR